MTKQLAETFEVIDGSLVRSVVPRRGRPYVHVCPIAVYHQLVWAAIDLVEGGFTIETLVDRVRNRPREAHDNGPSWSSLTNAAVALAFWKHCGLIDVRRKRIRIEEDYFFEDAMIVLHALAEPTV